MYLRKYLACHPFYPVPLLSISALGLVFLSMPAIRSVLLRSQAANPLKCFRSETSVDIELFCYVLYKRIFDQGSMVPYRAEKRRETAAMRTC